MSKETFIDVDFRGATLAMIDTANAVIEDYQAQGFRLTLRQLYYQLVSRNILPNTERSYKNLGNTLSKGRLAGFIDWDAIEDRIRVPQKITEWSSPEDIMGAVLSGYTLPRWDSQDNYVELWCEKDALAGVLRPIADQNHVTLMVNRGYSSQSAMKDAAERFISPYDDGKDCTILYIGDLDPSGEDMVRDIQDRLDLLTRGAGVEVIKLAITADQVAQFNPPPNPTKVTDSRAAGFVAKFGTSSYEADALPPDVLAALVTEAIGDRINDVAWREVIYREEADKTLLQQASDELMRRRGSQDANVD